MKVSIKSTIAATFLLTVPAIAGPAADSALAHFKTGCMAKPHDVNNSFSYFYNLKGFKPWGPAKERKPGTGPLGAKTDRMLGIFVFRNADKSATLLTSAGFGQTATCVSEFKPDLSWENFVASGQAYIATQSGFTGKVVSKRNGKSLQYSTDLGLFSLNKLNNGSFQIALSHQKSK